MSSLPTHRIAKARSICPCATTNTSPHTPFFFDSMTHPWYFDLISAMSRSSRLVTSSGDLEASFLSAIPRPLSHLLNHLRVGILSPRTSIPPDIPLFALAPLFPLLSDSLTSQALVVTVVPLLYILCDLYFCLSQDASVSMLSLVLLPRKSVMAAKVQKLEGSLRAFTRGNISRMSISSVRSKLME